MVSIKVEWEVVCAAWNGDIADDLEWPVTAPFSVFSALIIGSSATTLTAVILVESTSVVDVEFPQIPRYSAPQAL